MALTYYRWDDASAPTLNGTAGSIIALLDAILVTGYGAKAAAGWTKPYTGTNKAVFRMATTAGNNGHYLRCEAGGDTNRSMLYRGYISMSDVDTGTEPFPTVAQLSTGLYFQSSTASDATAREWYAIADENFFILISNAEVTAGTLNTASWAASRTKSIMFGQFDSYNPNDVYNTQIVGCATTSLNSSADRLGHGCAVPFSAQTGHYTPRRYIGDGTSFNNAKSSSRNVATFSESGPQYPDPGSGRIFLLPMYVREASIPTSTFGIIRGKIPYFYEFAHFAPAFTPVGVSFFETIVGDGDLAGKSFILVPAYNATTGGVAALQVAGSR